MSASLRNHHCLTQEEIRQYVQRHAALAEAEAAAGAGGESAESGDESSQTGSASATTTNPITMTVSANRTLADPLTVEDVTAGAARVTETAEALEALVGLNDIRNLSFWFAIDFADYFRVEI